MPFSYPWLPDNSDGTYRNPIIHADYSDPDVIRHGRDFWMTSSSFNCTPGLPILHSLDMVNWTLVNHAIKQVPHESYVNVRPGCGVWAPAIRFHGGLFWIFFPMPDEGIYVTTATDPAGEWSEPWLLQEAKGWIDPCPFWDDDGKAYLFHAYANSRAGKKERIQCRPMSPDGKKLLGEGVEVIHTPHHLYLEGPKLHKLNGWYYILAPGGGVQTGWQVAFRSRNIEGPYEEKIVLTQGKTDINGPHQGALVDLENGDWWFFHFQDVGPFGRIVHLQPVEWRDGWPLMGAESKQGLREPVASWKKPAVNLSEPVTPTGPATTDEFDSPALGLQWQWHANHQSSWADLAARPGWLRLEARPLPGLHIDLAPHYLAQKYPARQFTVETLLDFSGGAIGGISGLAIVGGGQSTALALRKTLQGDEFVFLVNGEVEPIGLSTGGPVRLRVSVGPDGSFGFGFATASGPAAALPRTFHAKEGGWIGAKVGLVSIAPEKSETQPSGHADYDWFRFQ